MPTGSDTQLQSLIDLARKGDPTAKPLLIDHACDRLLKLTRKMFHGFPGLSGSGGWLDMSGRV